MAERALQRPAAAIEWPTLALIAQVYPLWGALLWLGGRHGIDWASLPLAAVVCLQSSLQHECLHALTRARGSA